MAGYGTLLVELGAVPMERSTGRVIVAAIIVIAVLVVGGIWRADDQVEGQMASQEGVTPDVSQPLAQPTGEQTQANGQDVSQPAAQPTGEQIQTNGQDAAN
jgi:hypothetical protein